MHSKLRATARAYGISLTLVKVIVLFPAAIVLLYSVLLVVPLTAPMALSTTEERHLVETLTFVFLLLGGLSGVVLAWRIRKRRGKPLVASFYAVFSVLLLSVAGEEVAWGQDLFFAPDWYETPSALKEMNAQGQTTLHNIKGLQGHTEFFRLAFGLGGLLGVWAFSHQRFREVGAPAILLPWFLLITLLAGFDLYLDYALLSKPDEEIPRILELSNGLAEVIEMMIGISGCLFIWLKTKVLIYPTKDSSHFGA